MRSRNLRCASVYHRIEKGVQNSNYLHCPGYNFDPGFMRIGSGDLMGSSCQKRYAIARTKTTKYTSLGGEKREMVLVLLEFQFQNFIRCCALLLQHNNLPDTFNK